VFLLRCLWPRDSLLDLQLDQGQWDHVPPLKLTASRGTLLCELMSRPER